MFYATLLIVTMLSVSYGSKKETTIPVHSPSTFEIKEGHLYVTAYITCDSAPLDTPTAPLAGRWDEVRRVVLTGCSPPSPPDLQALAKSLAARGAAPLAIRFLELRNVPPHLKFNASHFEGLSMLMELKVQAAGDGHPEQLHGNFLQSLPQVKWLSLENEALPPMTKNVIRYLKLKRGRSLGEIGDCNKLYDLQLREWRVPTGVGPANGWLSECKDLAHLQAEHMEPDSLRMVLSRFDNLITLELPNNGLTQQDLLAALKKSSNSISILRVINNKLTNINNVLESQRRLETLDLSHNMLHDFPSIVHSIYASRELQNSMVELRLDHNPLRNFCDWTDNISRSMGRLVRNLKILSLVGINTSRVCFHDWKLINVDLSTNNIEELEFSQLPLSNNVGSLAVDLRQNPLRMIQLDELSYNNLTFYKSITTPVMINTDRLPLFDCDCKNGWLGRALREGRVWLSEKAICRGGESLINVPPATLECDLQPCAPCTCRQQWEPPSVMMDCNALGLNDIPCLPPNLEAELRELHLKGNRINTIRAEDLPATLTLVDLRDNNVSRVDKAASEVLFRVPERRVWFAGNPLACDCDNWPLLGALEVHHIQVEDYENVTCVDGRLLRDVSEEQLCGARSTSTGVWLGAGGGALVAVLGLLGVLYARYRRQLKVWLFARGWCLIWVREEELDTDRQYDVFVSFAHGDFEFVTSQLLPGLEDGPDGFNVCVHYRDWVPGELIPTQITRSVASSRRTLIVLSANFVQSIWGMVEFRAAHLSALTEGRVRLLVVLLEDAPPTDELPEELRRYLRSTTYLCWNDPSFWKKLRYVLPHRANRV